MPQETFNIRRDRGPALLAASLVLLILIPLAYSVVRAVATQGAERPERPASEHQQCVVDEVREVENNRDMRLRHWELLRGIREDVVRYGKRGDIGLGTCKQCHPSRERFCDRCHLATSLTPDCFDCHYYP